MIRVLTCARIQPFSLPTAGKATKPKSLCDVREKNREQSVCAEQAFVKEC